MNMSKFSHFFDILDGYVDDIDTSNGAFMDMANIKQASSD
jgi:hypothetical protein